MSSTCNQCSAVNSAGARFCNQCGSPLLDTTSGQRTPLATGFLPPQTTLRANRYQLLDVVGKGGMGAVYKALDLQLSNRVVAIKEMSQQGLSSVDLQEAIDTFTREASILAHLSHANLPRIYEQFEDGGRRYLVMEYVDGETLEQVLAQNLQQGRQLSLEQVLAIAKQLCVVLEYLHTQNPPIIFRDLKPGNIMLTARGQVYLIDFGIARFFTPGKTKDTIALGSSGYAPPEQYRQATSPRSDIYSLGATLHEMLTGDDPAQSPFHFRRFSVNQPDVERLVMHMVTLDEQLRPRSMREVRKALEQVGQQQTQPRFAGNATVTHRKKHTRVNTPAPSSSPVRVPAANIPMTLGVVGSEHPIDQRLWQGIRGQLTSLLAGFPSVSIQEIQPGGKSSTQQSMGQVNSADPILLLLSPDFHDSAQCQALMQRVLDRRNSDKIEVLTIYLRACSVADRRLDMIASVPEDEVYHTSLYAQEQRTLEVAKEIRRLLVMRLLAGRKTGPTNLLHWLLWQLYGYGLATCPYFVIGSYFLKHYRPAGLAAVLIHLFDKQKGRMIGEYLIGPIECADLPRLLRVIAPALSDPGEVQGIASRGNPLYARKSF